MGLDPEKMRAMLELSEKLVREKDGEEFAEAARHLFNIVKDAIAKLTGDTTGIAGSMIIVGSPTLAGPFLAVMIAWMSLAIAANQAAENAAQRREIQAIASMVESNTIAEFEVAYETARTSLSRFPDHPGTLLAAQGDLNVAKRTWVLHLVKTIENAPSPFEKTLSGGKGGRSPEFDNYISRGFAPVGRYLVIGVFCRFFCR